MAPFAEALKLYGERHYAQALESCRAEAKRSKISHRDPLYQRIVDEICMHSAATGRVIGFDGRLLQVIPANSANAWMDVQQQPQQTEITADRLDNQSLQFCSIQDALQEAQDGDVIELLPGTHVTSQAELKVSKRVLITARQDCTPQQVILDHRANHPAFSIERSSILRGFTVDMIGFTEALSISGASTTVKPILQDLLVCCSGDDGISVNGKAQPLIRAVEIRVRYCGLKQNDHASTTLWQSSIVGGKHALIAAGHSQTFFEGCKLQGCDQEGVLGLQHARVNLTDTHISDCQGCAIDMSDESSVVLKQVDITNCQGGIWLWHKSSCEAICSHIAGGSTYAVLLDAEAYARGSSCTIDGSCHITSMTGDPEDLEVSEGGSDDSLVSSGSPVYRGQPTTGGGGLPAAGRGQALCRQAFKAAAAAAAAAAKAQSSATGMTGIVMGPAGAVEASGLLQSSPFGSSNSSAAGSAYEFELGSYDDLVSSSMCVADKAAAAALFPPEVGAFAPPQHLRCGH